ncbi:hypothetical protein [Aliiroseovarius sp. 2305UL8-7]|uniref:hypothetical protein n=1 Tax=Aliiroseovarius conchicola TaxID=3121637 RepID=UPI003526D930
MKAVLVAISLVAGTSSVAMACTYGPLVFLTPLLNERVHHLKNCSFTGGGRDDLTIGRAAKDLGNGIVFQVVETDGFEQAVATDCRTKQQLSFFGADLEDETVHFSCSEVVPSKLNAPFSSGKFKLAAGKSLADLKSYAVKQGYMWTDFDWNFGLSAVPGYPPRKTTLAKKDRPDFYCGCKLHYPDTPGAAG